MLGRHNGFGSGDLDENGYEIIMRSGTLIMENQACLGGSDGSPRGFHGGVFIVSGGKVTINRVIKGGYGSDGSSGGYAPELRVYGGTVTISQWLPGNNRDDRRKPLTVYGGSLNFTDLNYGTRGMSYITPSGVEKFTITLRSETANRKIECFENLGTIRYSTTEDGNSEIYGIRDVYVSADSKLYFWRPPVPLAFTIEATANRCTPVIGTIPTNGTSATLNVFKAVQITYKCVGVGCQNPGTNVGTGVATGRCEEP